MANTTTCTPHVILPY